MTTFCFTLCVSSLIYDGFFFHAVFFCLVYDGCLLHSLRLQSGLRRLLVSCCAFPFWSTTPLCFALLNSNLVYDVFLFHAVRFLFGP